MKSIFVLIFVSASALARVESRCEIGKIHYEGVDHLSLTRFTRRPDLNNLTKIKTHRETTPLFYWPKMHAYGIKKLKEAYSDFGCPMTPRLIKCEFVPIDEGCEGTIKLTRVFEKEPFHTIPNVPGKSMQEVLKDFIDADFCH